MPLVIMDKHVYMDQGRLRYPSRLLKQRANRILCLKRRRILKRTLLGLISSRNGLRIARSSLKQMDILTLFSVENAGFLTYSQRIRASRRMKYAAELTQKCNL